MKGTLLGDDFAYNMGVLNGRLNAKFRMLALVLTVLLTTLGGPLLQAGEKKIALTFEKLPYMKPLGFWRPREVSNLILRSLEEEGIKAAAFLVQVRVEDDPSTYIIISDWVTRGHIVGNQTWGDADFNELTADQFMEHAVDGQKYLKRVARAHPFNYRYLRFPQLHEGNDARKKREVRKELRRGEYQIAHVTVKTSDYLFNRPYVENEAEPEQVERLKKLYLRHVGQALDYAESQSQKVFERNIAHILQLRAGVATAMFLDDLIQMLRDRGYEFVSLPEALSDPAYTAEEEYVGPLGLSFIDRVAATRGLEFDEDSGASLREDDIEKALAP